MKRSVLLLLFAGAGEGCSDGEVDPDNPSRLEIAGRVTRAEDGTPLAGAMVWLSYPTAVGDGAEIATTADDGSYEVVFDKDTQIATCEGFALYAQAEGYLVSDIRGVECVAEVQREDFALVRAPE